MIIRRANTADIPALGHLLSQVLQIHHEGRPDLFRGGVKKYTDEELAVLLCEESRPVFAAVDEQDRLLGYAFCVLEEHRDHNILTDIKTLYIDDLCVDEAARGQHVGKALYTYVRAFAKEQGCYNLTLNVWACNTSAQRFYEAMGLRPQKIGMETVL